MLLSVGFFSGMDALLKTLSQTYPALELGALRGAASLPFVFVATLVRGSIKDLRPVRWSLHLVRGVLAIVMLGSFIYALRLLPMADAYALFLAAPLIVTAMSVPLLGEHVEWRRWVAIVIGLAGTLVLLKPTAASLATVGALAAVAAAVCYALSALTIRVLTKTDTTASMVFWFMAMVTVFAGALAAPHWVRVQPEHWSLLIGIGILGGLAATAIGRNPDAAAQIRGLAIILAAFAEGLGVLAVVVGLLAIFIQPA